MTYRAILVGCGAMSKGWLKALGEAPLSGEIELVGLVDVDRKAAEARAAEAGLTGVAIGTDLEPMLTGLKPDLLFDVALPSTRRNIVAAGLQHGCHVLTEKPMAASMDEARELVAMAAKAGKVHAVVQNRRFNEGVRRIRATIESGALGTLNAIHCDFFVGAHFGGFREQMRDVLLVDMAIHTLDAARFMSGKVPLAVYCLEANPRSSWYAHGSVANAIFEFSDDVIFNYRGSWSAEGANTSWDSSWRIVGSKGTLLWDGADRFEANIVAGDTGFFRDLTPVDVAAAKPEETRGHASVIESFIAAIKDGRQPETASSDNIKSLAMVFAAIDSAQKRQRVEISA